MTSWQKRARIGIAVFGVAFAILVYTAIGERQAPVPPTAVERLDPKALMETVSGALQRVTGVERDFDVSFERSLSYEDGSSRFFGVTITVKNRGGRDYVITAREAFAGKGQTDLQLTGDVKLVASDGFELTTSEATFNQETSLARAEGAVDFRKGRMSGSGRGMSYDQPRDVLHFAADSKVIVVDGKGRVTLDFSAGASTLDRLQHVLSLENTVHVVRDEQVIDGDRGTARLSETNEIVTYIELRGNARVAGGGSSIDSMSGRDIDLDYTDDGETLERVALNGGGAIAMTPTGTATGRRLRGEALNLELSPDGSLTRALGEGAVGLDLPGTDASAARTITADRLDATGAAGRGLTGATFTSEGCGPGPARQRCVEYREERKAGAPRVAHASRLVATLSDDAVSSAVFTGAVTFEEDRLSASAGELRYAPDAGTLQLAGSTGAAGPRVEDEQVTIEGRAIDIALDTRHMSAKGDVQTTLRPARSTAGAGQGDAGQAGRRPGFLKPGESVRVNGGALEYLGAAGKATYTGNALLTQGTASTIRGSEIVIDQQTGDLVATGNARSDLTLDGGRSTGLAHEMRYDERTRVITYSLPGGAAAGRAAAAPVLGGGPQASGTAAASVGAVPEGGRAAAPASATTPPAFVRLVGPDGDISAQRIEIVLATDANRVDRLEAYVNVSVKLGSRTASGARLTYHAADERYVMSAAAGTPVLIRDGSRVQGCSEASGQTLTFFKGTDTMTLGGEVARTQTKSGGPCGLPSTSR